MTGETNDFAVRGVSMLSSANMMCACVGFVRVIISCFWCAIRVVCGLNVVAVCTS
jgi:hypothetical protein